MAGAALLQGPPDRILRGGGKTQVNGDGSVSIAPKAGQNTTLASGALVFSAAVSQIIPGATSFAIRNNANGADNLLVSDAGVVTARAGIVVTAGGIIITAGDLTFSAAASRIIPGATSLALRNTANNANNVLVNDAGDVTIRNGLTVTAAGATFNRDNIVQTPTDAATLINATDATVGVQEQWSPALRMTGAAWNPTALASNDVDWRMYTVPYLSSGVPTSYVSWDESRNGAAFNRRMVLTSAGRVGLGDVLTVTPESLIHIRSDDSNSATIQIILSMASTNTSGVGMHFRKARGTHGALTGVGPADGMMHLASVAYDGVQYDEVCYMRMEVDGSYVAGERPPSRFVFYTNTANNGQVERLRIAGDGLVTFGDISGGISAAWGSYNVRRIVAGADASLAVQSANTAATGNSFLSQKARGTLAAPTIVVSGDAVLALHGLAYDGASFQNVAQIIYEVDGTPGAGDMPGRIRLLTVPDGSTTLTEGLRVDNAQITTMQAGLRSLLPALTVAASTTVNAAPATVDITQGVDAFTYTATSAHVALPGIQKSLAGNSTGAVVLTGLNIITGGYNGNNSGVGIGNVTVTMIRINPSISGSNRQGNFTYYGADITNPSQGANGLENNAIGIIVTLGTSNGSSSSTQNGLYIIGGTQTAGTQRGIFVTMANSAHRALHIAVGKVRIDGQDNTGVARSTGIGTVKFADATARDNVGFLAVDLGATTYYIPVFAAN